jgi:hypothetical protein
MTSLSEIIELMAKESVTGTMGPELVSLLLTRPDSRTDARLDRSVLVGLLNHNAVIVRELAIEHLMHISQKDAMEYDADDPSEKSINAWIMWLNSVREKNR